MTRSTHLTRVSTLILACALALPERPRATPGPQFVRHEKVLEGSMEVLACNDQFGRAISLLEDLNGDGVADLAVGAPMDDDDGPNFTDRGAVWVLFLNPDGTVRGEQKINESEGGFQGVIGNNDNFGYSLAALGDLDGDGVGELAVGEPFDGVSRGAVWVLFMSTGGTVKAEQKIAEGIGGFQGSFNGQANFGLALAGLGDLDGDGVEDLAVGAMRDNDGGFQHGAVWVLFLNADGTVKAQQKISDVSGDFGGSLDDFDGFGSALGLLGDLDGDGVADLAVGASGDDDGGRTGFQDNHGALWVLFLNTDGTVKGWQKISDLEGGFQGVLEARDFLGDSVSTLGDLDGDGNEDLAVGARGDDDGGLDRGAFWILFLDADGTVKAEQKVSQSTGGFPGTLCDEDEFASSLGFLGDLDGDGFSELAAGAPCDDGGVSGSGDRGAVWALSLDVDGTVRLGEEIANNAGGFAGALDVFGSALGSVGDLDGDGIADLAVGLPLADAGEKNRGAVRLLFLKNSGAVKSELEISSLAGGFRGLLDGGDWFGSAVCSPGDLDANGMNDLVVGAPRDDDGGLNRGAVWVLFLGPENTVEAETKISDTHGGLLSTLNDSDGFGSSVGSIGDLNGDGVGDLVVGSPADDDGGPGRGAVYVVLLQPDGTVALSQKISGTAGGFLGSLDDDDGFGSSVGSCGDLDGDGVNDLVVGAPGDDDGGADRGAVWILLLHSDGTVKAEHKISSAIGGLSGRLDDGDRFGSALNGTADLDLDGVRDLVVGAPFDNEDLLGAPNRGSVWLLFLDPAGTVRAEEKLFGRLISNNDLFGSAVSPLGDLDGNGRMDLAVGVPLDDVADRGAVHLLFQNGRARRAEAP